MIDLILHLMIQSILHLALQLALEYILEHVFDFILQLLTPHRTAYPAALHRSCSHDPIAQYGFYPTALSYSSILLLVFYSSS